MTTTDPATDTERQLDDDIRHAIYLEARNAARAAGLGHEL